MKIVLILLVVLIFGLTCLYKIQENFENVYTTTTLPSDNYIVNMIDSVLNDINNKYNTNYITGDIERVNKRNLNNKTNYNIIVFIYETQKYKTLKLEINLDVDSSNNITINLIKEINVSNLMDRSKLTDSFTKIYKTELDKYYGNNSTNLEYSNIEFNETKNKNLNRNKWIKHDNNEKLKSLGFKQFPCRNMKHTWDDKGIMNSEPKTEQCNGIYSGTVEQHLQPYFNPTIFIRNEDSYKWLFDVASDSASRQVGITGASGSS